MKGVFYINMIRFGKKREKKQEKEKNDHCRMTVEKKQHWNLKYQIWDPIIPHVYEFNIVKAEIG